LSSEIVAEISGSCRIVGRRNIECVAMDWDF
jgi:hypothetical protein